MGIFTALSPHTNQTRGIRTSVLAYAHSRTHALARTYIRSAAARALWYDRVALLPTAAMIGTPVSSAEKLACCGVRPAYIKPQTQVH